MKEGSKSFSQMSPEEWQKYFGEHSDELIAQVTGKITGDVQGTTAEKLSARITKYSPDEWLQLIQRCPVEVFNYLVAFCNNADTTMWSMALHDCLEPENYGFHTNVES